MTRLPNGYLQSKRELFIHAPLHNLIFKLKHKTCHTELDKIWIIYDFSTHFIPANISFSKLPQVTNNSSVC